MTFAHHVLPTDQRTPPVDEASLADRLRGIACFNGVANTTLDTLSKACRALSYAAGDIIGGPAAGEAMIAFVVSGTARISMPPDRHGDVTFSDVGMGGLFGHLEALAQEQPRLSAVALGDCDIIILPADDFRVLIEANPSIALHILKTQALDAMSESPRVPPQPGSGSYKLYAELLRMAELSQDDTGTLLISKLPRHRQLADWTGLSEADVAGSLAELVKSGCAERRYPGLAILDADKLRQLAGE
ncbi:MAG: Crp/Fnr family transcriptional regulator [Candidatus Phaeomarinobacter sp.]